MSASVEMAMAHLANIQTGLILSIFSVQVKAASDIYAPVSGQIEAVNEKLNDEPSLLNKQPESDGTYHANSLRKRISSSNLQSLIPFSCLSQAGSARSSYPTPPTSRRFLPLRLTRRSARTKFAFQLRLSTATDLDPNCSLPSRNVSQQPP